MKAQGLNDFPALGINTQELVDAVDALIDSARQMMHRKEEEFGAVNWGDIGVADVEYRLSMLRPSDGPHCVVLVEEASPACRLESWLSGHLDKDKFPRTHVECEW